MNFLKKKLNKGAVVVAVTVKLGDSPSLSIRAHAASHSFYRLARKTFGLPFRPDELSTRTKRKLNEIAAMARHRDVTCVLIPVSQPTCEAVKLAKEYLLAKNPDLAGKIIDPGVNYILPSQNRTELARFTAKQHEVADYQLM